MVNANDNIDPDGYPLTHRMPEGKVVIYSKRGFDRKGYAAYLYEFEDSIIPRVGVGVTPQIAIQDIFTERS